jgi:branched-chain amino acid transport system substrate-binding protein
MRRRLIVWWCVLAAVTVGATGCGGGSGAFKVGLLVDCVGNLSGVQESALAGAELPLIQRGARLAGTRPSQGLHGARAGGRRVRIVLGCSESGVYATLVDEARRLIESERVNAVIGPIGSGDGIVLRDLARRYPKVPFLLADAIAQEATLDHPQANVFRFTMDVAQRSAGLGTYAFRVLGWRRAAVVAGDDAIGWGGAAGFVAEFCASGGQVVRAATTHSLPAVDGVALLSSAGFTSGATFVRDLAQAHRDWRKRLLVGPFAYAFDQGLASAIIARGGGVIAASTLAPAAESAAVGRYLRAFATAFGGPPPGLALDTIAVPYDVAMQALVTALDSDAPLLEALARVRITGPEGPVRLDSRRQAIGTNYLVRIGSRMRVVATVPRVDQTFGGLFRSDGPPPSATWPRCRKGHVPAFSAAVSR